MITVPGSGAKPVIGALSKRHFSETQLQLFLQKNLTVQAIGERPGMALNIFPEGCVLPSLNYRIH